MGKGIMMRSLEEIKADMAKPCDYTDTCELTAELILALASSIPLDRLEQICQADREGRYVVLPCKVGDTVFSFRWSATREKYDLRCGTAKSVRYDEPEGTVMISDGEFILPLGKRIFLTREAAEAALKERESNDD